jgi:membrane-associated phospholipid phosphatase
MKTLLRCFDDNAADLPDHRPLLWLILGILGLVLALRLSLFGFMLLRRRRDWIEASCRYLNERLSRHAPGPWGFLKSRFSRNELIGLELTLSATSIVLFIALFAEILESWSDEETLYSLDAATHCALAGILSGRSLEVFRFITHFADALTLVVLSTLLLGLLAWRRQWWQALALFLAIAVGQGLLWGMKWFFARPRPDQQLIDAVGQSFPSGHSFSAMVFYGFLVLLLWQFRVSRALRVAGTLVIAALILAIGLSRLLLSVHWVSDVVGGFVIGLAWLLASLLAARGWFAWRERDL